MKALAVFAVACIALVGCGLLPAPDRAAPPAPERICPALRAWSEADLKALAQALAPIPEDSVITRMALDWRRYYGDAKACARPH